MRPHLVEVPVEAILIVGNGGNEGQDEAAAAPDLTVPSAVLGVLPQSAVVLLMHAHRLLDDHGLPCIVDDTEVLNTPCSEATASSTQLAWRQETTLYQKHRIGCCYVSSPE